MSHWVHPDDVPRGLRPLSGCPPLTVKRSKLVVPPADWDCLGRMMLKAARDREPSPVLDWMRDNLPDPWSALGHEPVEFFKSVSPFPLVGVDP